MKEFCGCSCRRRVNREGPKRIAYAAQTHLNGRIWYVSQLPGHEGVGWGHDPDVKKALPLSLYWQRRWKAECDYINRTARFLEVKLEPSVEL